MINNISSSSQYIYIVSSNIWIYQIITFNVNIEVPHKKYVIEEFLFVFMEYTLCFRIILIMAICFHSYAHYRYISIKGQHTLLKMDYLYLCCLCFSRTSFSDPYELQCFFYCLLTLFIILGTLDTRTLCFSGSQTFSHKANFLTEPSFSPST